MPRKFPRKIRRIVIKVGSSVIATYKMKPRIARLRSLVEQIVQAQKSGIEVIVVSSGAIVLGMGELNQKSRPQDLPSLQAFAALGQVVLMQTYTGFFKNNKSKCAQVLLTWDDFNNRSRQKSAKNALDAMLDRKIVPIINENDTISTEEIKFGDNDKLSALVASMIQADLLLILSDVDGLYDDRSGDKKFFKEIKEITEDIRAAATGTNNKNMSKGGMTAKLEAVKIAAHAKVPSIIANGELKDVLSRVLKGERLGTFFSEKEDRLIARKHWISFGAKPKGIVVIDDGAKKALLKGGVSLLLPGVVSATGSFSKGDVIILHDTQKNEIARGESNYSSADLQAVQDRKGKLEVIHCDNLVFCER